MSGTDVAYGATELERGAAGVLPLRGRLLLPALPRRYRPALPYCGVCCAMSGTALAQCGGTLPNCHCRMRHCALSRDLAHRPRAPPPSRANAASALSLSPGCKLPPTPSAGPPVCDPRECQPCPAGLACQGGRLEPEVAGSEWEEVRGAGSHYLRLAACPPGHVLVRNEEVPQLDQCIACPPGYYHTRRAVFGHSLTVRNAEDAAGECLPCETGATCPGGRALEPQAGFW
eukprot:2247463-Rhodomonas_salina.2